MQAQRQDDPEGDKQQNIGGKFNLAVTDEPLGQAVAV